MDLKFSVPMFTIASPTPPSASGPQDAIRESLLALFLHFAQLIGCLYLVGAMRLCEYRRRVDFCWNNAVVFQWWKINAFAFHSRSLHACKKGSSRIQRDDVTLRNWLQDGAKETWT